MKRQMLIAAIILLVATPLVFDADRDDSCECGTSYRFRTAWSDTYIKAIARCSPETNKVICFGSAIKQPLGRYVNLY